MTGHAQDPLGLVKAASAGIAALIRLHYFLRKLNASVLCGPKSKHPKCDYSKGETEMPSTDTLKAKLGQISSTGAPALRQFAPWVLDNLSLVAIHSIRRVAGLANVNPNTVTRLAKELGYSGFDALRADVQASLNLTEPNYGERARALRQRSGGDAFTAVIEAHRDNTLEIFSAENLEILDSCIDPLLNARRVHAIGVRSCYSVAHYLSYLGGMAFANFAEVPSMPGGIVDQISQVTPDDIVVGITYAHYSAEVVKACEIAREKGARLLALTDSHTSPIAIGAWKVLPLPMAGPNFMPSLTSAFLAVELLLVGMASRSDSAAGNVTAFEERIRLYGGYAGRGAT
jgi:DNA-binding MurR/RpiR family transcriptional regulator